MHIWLWMLALALSPAGGGSIEACEIRPGASCAEQSPGGTDLAALHAALAAASRTP